MSRTLQITLAKEARPVSAYTLAAQCNAVGVHGEQEQSGTCSCASTPSVIGHGHRVAWVDALPQATLLLLEALANAHPEALDALLPVLRGEAKQEIGPGHSYAAGRGGAGFGGGPMLAAAKKKTNLPMKALVAVWDHLAGAGETVLAKDIIKCFKDLMSSIKDLSKISSCKNQLGLLQNGPGGELCKCLGAAGGAITACALVVYAYRDEICKKIDAM